MQNNPVVRLFNEIAPKYDLLNRLLSFNIDRRWRNLAIQSIEIQPEARVLDVCTGTADVAIAMAEKYTSMNIYGIDFSEEMLKAGKIKVAGKNLDNSIELIKADALHLPFPDRIFDIICVSFGIRNLRDRKKGIQEIKRVLRENGQIIILEFSPPPKTLLGKCYHLYLGRIVPFIGKIISQSAFAYQYLYTSIEHSLEPEEIVDLLKDNELQEISYQKLTFGIVYLYIAR